MAKKGKKEKKNKGKKGAQRVVVRKPRVPLTVKDVLVGFVAGVFLVISLVFAGYSMYDAIFGEYNAAQRAREEARIADEEAKAAAARAGAIWFSLPDGTFTTGDDPRLATVSGAASAPEPAIPSEPEPAPESEPEAGVTEQV